MLTSAFRVYFYIPATIGEYPPPHTISRVYFYIPAITGLVSYSIASILLYTRRCGYTPSFTGILLYTRSSVLSLIPTISRVYFYIPANRCGYIHSIVGILLCTRKQMWVHPQYCGYIFIYPQTKCVYEIATSDDVLLAMTEGTPLQRHSERSVGIS